MARAGPKKVREYSPEFKVTAVRLSQQAALDIHPFMLSKWRKQVQDGVLRGKGRYLVVPPVREIRRLQELERAHVLLQAEVIHGTRFTTEIELRRELACYMRYYNHRRLHSALGYCSPVDYESHAA